MQYGQEKIGLTDRQWKSAFIWVALFCFFPYVVTVGFVAAVMYISASNHTGCVKEPKMGRMEFWLLVALNVFLLAVLVAVMHSKGVF